MRTVFAYRAHLQENVGQYRVSLLTHGGLERVHIVLLLEHELGDFVLLALAARQCKKRCSGRHWRKLQRAPEVTTMGMEA